MLPTQDMQWPPVELQDAYTHYDTMDAWYRGDIDQLATIYGRNQGRTHVRNGVRRRGGVIPALQSFFWGRPVPANERRTRLHAPLAANLARLSSELMFGIPPLFDLADGTDTKTGDRLDEIMNSPMVRLALLDGAELQSALGGVAYTIAWDTEQEDTPWLQVSGADMAVPSFTAGHLTALTLWSEYPQPNSATVYRHLERHEPGVIYHGLYQGTDTNLGGLVPLDRIEQTAPLAELVEDMNGAQGIKTGTLKLTAAYIPNAAAKDWRKDGALSDLGRSDFEGLEGMLDSLDETWSSWMRDIRLGKARITVPRNALDNMTITDHDGNKRQVASFDSDREVYQELNLPPDMIGNGGITSDQFAIRVAEHSQTTKDIAAQIILGAGYSLTDVDQYSTGAAATATEVTDRRSQSERTRDRKALAWQANLGRLAQAMLEVDGNVFPGRGGGPIDRPTVTFAETATPDPQQVAQTISFLRSAQVMSVEVAVRRANPDWTDQQVQEELDRLTNEGSLADPATLDRVNSPADASEDNDLGALADDQDTDE